MRAAALSADRGVHLIQAGIENIVDFDPVVGVDGGDGVPGVSERHV
jgi:hypothetical protein